MRVAVLICVLAAVVGCGAGVSSPAATPGPTSLTVTYWPQGPTKAAAGTWTLRCAPASGTLPRPGRACVKLNALPKPFAPTPKDMACIELYGGPQTAVVRGTFRGERISVTLRRSDGCEIARFDKHAFLVPGYRAGTGGEA